MFGRERFSPRSELRHRLLHRARSRPFHATNKRGGKTGHVHGFNIVSQNGVEGSTPAVTNGPKHGLILPRWIHIKVRPIRRRSRPGCRSPGRFGFIGWVVVSGRQDMDSGHHVHVVIELVIRLEGLRKSLGDGTVGIDDSHGELVPWRMT